MAKKLTKKTEIVPKFRTKQISTVYEQIASIIRDARANIVRAIDTTMVHTYWYVGKYIVEEEQLGKTRAGYGNYLIVEMDSLLFERLAKSKDKKGLMKLANKGHEIIKPEDAIKDPIILEFLELPESHKLIESKLEEALINNMQKFLLELGKGFAFVARQKRLTLDGQHFYADLVMYNTVLHAYTIIDLKTKPLTHADLGQMQLYVNYFDMENTTSGDNPTIGLILCTRKSDKMVKYFFKEKDRNIFASKYQFHLPTEQELETELKKEINEFKYRTKHKS